MAAHIKEQISSLQWLQKSSDKPVYMVGGTWRALARIHMAQKKYDLKMLHHYQMRSADILDFSKLIGNLSPESVEHIHEANAVRRPYLPVSAMVLYRIAKLTGCNKLIVSANGLREGIIYNSLSTALKDKDPLMVACEDISKRMTKDPLYGAELQQWTAGLFNGQGLSPKKLKKYNRLRRAACLIGDMAWNQHNDYRCWFAANTILRAPLNCINHKGRRFLAHALYTRHNGSQSELPLGMEPVDNTTLDLSRALGLAFRLAHCLSGSLHGLINDTRLSRRGKKLVFEMDAGRSRLYGPIVEKRVCALADALNLQPEIYIGADKIQLS
jgi:exopolyphosphatase/guanosine-5'-triphosphate,3'-diphosphate pyrophosphatase